MVPVELASAKSEWTAATIRRKIHRLWDRFLISEAPLGAPRKDSLSVPVHGAVRPDPETLRGLDIDRTVPPVGRFKGGGKEALLRLDRFIGGSLRSYHVRRNDPGQENQSGLSPYLHFGQISPLTVAMRVGAASGVPQEAKVAFMEELIVRRELAFNFVFYEKHYDRYRCLPDWAKATLESHNHGYG